MDPISTRISLGAAGATSASNYWVNVLATDNVISGDGIDLDSSGNVYVVGDYSDSTLNNGGLLTAKYNSAGNFQWGKVLYGLVNGKGRGIGVDSNGNIYSAGYSNSASASDDAILAKYNANGVLQWQRSLATAGAIADNYYSIGFDSDNNIYVCGYGNNFNALIVKYNSAGTLLWQRELDSGLTDIFYGINVDNGNSIYACGTTATGGTDALIAKYNSSGTLTWQRTVSGGSNESFNCVTTDSSQNVYVAGVFGSTTGILIKLNSSGSILWHKAILNPSRGARITGIALDSLGNVYVCGNYAPGMIFKYDSNGNTQWQRSIADSSLIDIAIDSNNDLYITGFFSSNTKLLTVKLPSDGSLTGTYAVGPDSFVYSVSTFTETTLSPVASTSSLTSSSSTLTSSTSTLSEINGVISSSKANI